jgi:hypothetical protein
MSLTDWTAVPTGRKLGGPDPSGAVFDLSPLHDATDEIVEAARKRGLQEIDAAHFYGQRGMQLTDTETGIEYTIAPGHVEFATANGCTRYVIRGDKLVLLRVRGADHGLVTSEIMGTMSGIDKTQ